VSKCATEQNQSMKRWVGVREIIGLVVEISRFRDESEKKIAFGM